MAFARGSADIAGSMRFTRAVAEKLFFSPGAIFTSRGSSVVPGTSEPMLTVTVRVSASNVVSGMMSATAMAVGRWLVIS